MARDLKVTIVGDASSLERAFGAAGKSASGFGSTLGKFGKAAALGLGAAGVGGALAIMKTGFEEASESAKVMAQTGAVIKSTGGAARVSAKHVSDLAGSLLKMSGVDDEAIQSGENMLLTFTKIQNKVGKGNDIFDQATKATLNLSVAMGKDMSSSAILVGKALNDPIRGMGALSKAGIQFTEAQKDQIKAMVASGDAMGAQKMILRELETQFGGSAKAAGDTLPGQLAKAKEAFANVSGQIMTAMLPALTKLLQGFSDLLVWAQANWPKFRDTIVAVFDRIRAVTQQLVDWYRTNVQPAVQNVLAVLSALWDKFGGTITAVVKVALESALTIIRDTLNVIKGVINVALSLLRGDWSGAWEALKSVVSNAFDAIATMMTAQVKILAVVGAKIGGALKDALLGALEGIGSGIVGVFTSAINSAIDLINKAIDAYNAIPVAPNIGKVGKIGGGVPEPKLPGGLAKFPGKRAAGGPVTAGRPYLVGERGMELFVPRMSGMIVPNSSGGPGLGSLGGGGKREIRIVLEGGNFYGSPNRQAAEEWARALKPHLDQAIQLTY